MCVYVDCCCCYCRRRVDAVPRRWFCASVCHRRRLPGTRLCNSAYGCGGELSSGTRNMRMRNMRLRVQCTHLCTFRSFPYAAAPFSLNQLESDDGRTIGHGGHNVGRTQPSPADDARIRPHTRTAHAANWRACDSFIRLGRLLCLCGPRDFNQNNLRVYSVFTYACTYVNYIYACMCRRAHI